jgi:hypothetical protein
MNNNKINNKIKELKECSKEEPYEPNQQDDLDHDRERERTEFTHMTAQFLSKYNVYNNNRENNRADTRSLKNTYKDMKFYKKRFIQLCKNLYSLQMKRYSNNLDRNKELSEVVEDTNQDMNQDILEAFHDFMLLSFNNFKFIDKSIIIQEEYNQSQSQTQSETYTGHNSHDLDKTFFLDKNKIALEDANKVLIKHVDISLKGKPIHTLMNLKRKPLYETKPTFIPKQKKINIKDKRFKHKNKNKNPNKNKNKPDISNNF